MTQSPEYEAAKAKGQEALYLLCERSGLMIADGLDQSTADRIAWQQVRQMFETPEQRTLL